MEAIPLLEQVFTVNGVPLHTFVEPNEYGQLLLNLRTAGRGLVVEGPSGIGKTTAIDKALDVLGLNTKVTKLSSRKPKDIEYIALLPELNEVGTVVVDDFHKLSADIRSRLADYIKVLADEQQRTTKLIVVGINRAGENLIHFAPDLVNRLDVIRFDSNPEYKVAELVEKGEKALNISLGASSEIKIAAQGSFYLAQMLCREMCLAASVLQRQEGKRDILMSFEGVQARVWERLSSTFRARCERFCRGTRLKREGRAPYLHLLYWLARCDDWTLDIAYMVRHNPSLRGSVTQVVEKGYLSELINNDEEIRAVLHFDPDAEQLTVDDPQFLFFIRNIAWRKLADRLGFLSVNFDRRYDFALSFAGADRDIAKLIADELQENEVEVFYDKFEQHRILAEDIEEYLRPIYNSEARFVVVLLGQEYPKRIWTKIESDAFRERFESGAVIPIWFSDAPLGVFDESRQKGGIEIDRLSNIPDQVSRAVRVLLDKVAESRVGTDPGIAPAPIAD